MAEKEFGTSKLLGIGLLAIIVATVGTSFLTSYLLRDNDKNTTQVAKPKNLVTMPVGDFTVNLADKGGRHFLRSSVSLAVKQEGAAKLQAAEAQVRDLVIQVLRSKASSALQDAQALETLRKELLGKLNHTFGEGEVFAIYFTDFVVQ